MDQRTQFLIQVLERIGGPLSAAVTMSGGDASQQDAQRMAELLNRAVQLGLSIASDMNVRDESQADGVHLSLAAFASPLIASQFSMSGRVPGDNDIRRLSTALQAVLTFADNFSPAADTTLRLKNVDAGAEPADEPLIHVQMMGAFVPVLQTVMEFSFGRPENKVLQDVANRIMEDSKDLVDDLFGPDLSLKAARQAQLSMVKTLSTLYAGCHVSETRRIMAMDEKSRIAAMNTLNMDRLWESYNRHIDVIRMLATQIVPMDETQQGSGSGGVSGPAPQPIRQADIEPAKPAAPATPPANPMAFFANPRKDTAAE